MRPRHKAAENVGAGGEGALHAAEASMRPRHKAAENVAHHAAAVAAHGASMRPRHKAAENLRTGVDDEHIDFSLQ